jgi:hypothetical protein
MNATFDFLMKQHDHVLESIKLADQKAAAIIAISVGTIYLLYDLLKAPCFAAWPWKCVGGFAQILLLLSTGAALWTIAPPSESAYRDVEGGKLTIPDRAAQLSQAEYLQRITAATPEEKAEEVAALVYYRLKVRAWKYVQIQWAIWIMYLAYAQLLLLVCHLMVHTVRTRKARGHGHKAPDSGEAAAASGTRPTPSGMTGPNESTAGNRLGTTPGGPPVG